jgi:type IV secretory pathway protease TraF
VTFARARLTNCLPVYIFNACDITAVAAWRTLRIGKRAKPVAEFGMMLVVGPDRRHKHDRPKDHCRPPHKTANMIECARSDIMSEPLDVGQYPLYIY